MRVRVVLSVAALVALGCSSSGSSSGGGTSLIPAHGVAIQVSSVELARSFGGVTADSGKYFARLGTGIGSASENEPISIAPALFSVKTTASQLLVSATPKALSLSDCPLDAKLPGGKSHSCHTVFELADAERPVELQFAPPGLPPASANVPAQSCTFCGDDCVDLATNPQHCGACFQPAPAGGTCSGCPGGTTSCAGACVDVSSDLFHCGGCNQPVPVGGSCVGGVASCPGGLLQCGNACVDVSNDPAHCGACGQAVPDGQKCMNGNPVCEESAETICSGQCVYLYGDAEHCGSCQNACGENCTMGQCTYSAGETIVLGVFPKSCDEYCGTNACVEAHASYGTGFGGCPRQPDLLPIGCNAVAAQDLGECYLTGVYCQCAE